MRPTHSVMLGSLMLLAAGAASAQSNVAVYGSVDAGISSFNDERGARSTKLDSGNRSPDRIGFRGTEDLGNGMRAVFQLENGFNVDDGNAKRSNALFSRYAFVGLAGKAGMISFGHMPDFMYENLRWSSNGIMGSSYFFHPGNLDNQANQFQVDNAVKYESPLWHGFTFGAMNGFGEQADSFNRGRSYSFGARYMEGPARFGAAYTVSNNRSLNLGATLGIGRLLGQALSADPAAANATYTNFNADKVTNAGVSGAYKLGRFTPHAMYTQTRLETARGAATMRNTELGTDILFGITQTLGVSASTSELEGRRWNQLNLIHMIALSRRTTLYGAAAWQRARGDDVHAVIGGAAPASGQAQRVLRIGVHHLF